MRHTPYDNKYNRGCRAHDGIGDRIGLYVNGSVRRQGALSPHQTLCTIQVGLAQRFRLKLKKWTDASGFLFSFFRATHLLWWIF